MRLTIVALLLSVVCILATGCAALGERDGRIDARRDLANGILAYETCGHPFPWDIDKEFTELLRDRYDIELRRVGCHVSSRIASHVRGYNEVMEAELDRRFCTNIWEATLSEAVKRREDKKSTIRRSQ